MSIKVVSERSPLFQDIKCLRQRHLGENPGEEDNFEAHESRRDSCSYHLAYFDGEALAGAMRVTPLGHGITFAERVLDAPAYFSSPMEVFDANRLVVDRAYRGGWHMKLFMLEAATWLLRNTSFRYVCALCRENLASLYLNIGGELLASDIRRVPKQEKRPYSLVSLELETVYRTIKGRKENGEVLQRAG